MKRFSSETIATRILSGPLGVFTNYITAQLRLDWDESRKEVAGSGDFASMESLVNAKFYINTNENSKQERLTLFSEMLSQVIYFPDVAIYLSTFINTWIWNILPVHADCD